MSKEEEDPKQPKADERVVVRDESELPPDADAEERFNHFWKENGTLIFGAIALAAVIVVGRQTYDYIVDRREEGVRTEYREAIEQGKRETFVEAHPKHRLSGLAQLELGDEAYREREFAQAREFYEGALKLLKDPYLRSQCRLGLALSRYQTGDKEGGMKELDELRLDRSAGVADVVRQEAGYHLAVARWEQGDLEGARAALDFVILEAQEGDQFWTRYAERLLDRIGAAEDDVTAAAETEPVDEGL